MDISPQLERRVSQLIERLNVLRQERSELLELTASQSREIAKLDNAAEADDARLALADITASRDRLQQQLNEANDALESAAQREQSLMANLAETQRRVEDAEKERAECESYLAERDELKKTVAAAVERLKQLEGGMT